MSGALGLVVLAAVEAAEAGGTIDVVDQAARDAAGSANLFATLATLEYLKRGGRIGTAAAFFGNLLDLKPIISFEGGAVAPAGRVRSRGKRITMMSPRFGSSKR